MLLIWKKKNPVKIAFCFIFIYFLYSSLENNEYNDFSKLDINLLLIIILGM